MYDQSINMTYASMKLNGCVLHLKSATTDRGQGPTTSIGKEPAQPKSMETE